MNILICIALILGIYIEIIYIIEKKDILKNINYKAKYDLLKLNNQELLDNTTDLKSALEIANNKVKTNEKIVKMFRSIPTATKRKLGFIGEKKNEKRNQEKK